MGGDDTNQERSFLELRLDGDRDRNSLKHDRDVVTSSPGRGAGSESNVRVPGSSFISAEEERRRRPFGERRWDEERATISFDEERDNSCHQGRCQKEIRQRDSKIVAAIGLQKS